MTLFGNATFVNFIVLQLSEVAARCAQWVADQGDLEHNCPYKKGVGENLAWNSKMETSAVREETKNWYNEVKDYNYNRPGFSMKTGHFTQVVWKASTKLGIGAYRDQRTGRTYVVAHYSAPGNMNTKAEFQKNVLKP